jgi:hypothetical protein
MLPLLEHPISCTAKAGILIWGFEARVIVSVHMNHHGNGSRTLRTKEDNLVQLPGTLRKIYRPEALLII